MTNHDLDRINKIKNHVNLVYTASQMKMTLLAQESAIICGLSAKDCGLLQVIIKWLKLEALPIALIEQHPQFTT